MQGRDLKGYDGEIVQDGAKYLHSPVQSILASQNVTYIIYIYRYMIHMSYMINILVPVRF